MCVMVEQTCTHSIVGQCSLGFMLLDVGEFDVGKMSRKCGPFAFFMSYFPRYVSEFKNPHGILASPGHLYNALPTET